MFPRLWLPRRSAYDNTFFWFRECQDNEVRLYYGKFLHHWYLIIQPSTEFSGVDMVKKNRF